MMYYFYTTLLRVNLRVAPSAYRDRRQDVAQEMEGK